MKKISLILLSGLLAACSYFISIDELARNIQQQMQREFNSSADYRAYRLQVMQLKVTERSGQQFKALAQVRYQGQDYPLQVYIQQVEQGYTWQLEEDAFAFIDEVEIQRYQQQLEQELAALSLQLEQEQAQNQLFQAQTSADEIHFQPMQESVRQIEAPIPVGNITAYTR